MRFDKRWTKWVGLHDAVSGRAIGAGPGAYVIRAGRPIHRAVGTDKLGIIDIGESTGLRSRLRAFAKCASTPGAQGHMAGWRYADLGMDTIFPLAELLVRWCDLQSKDEAVKVEAEVMTKYIKIHYELPPLNYKFNWSLLHV